MWANLFRHKPQKSLVEGFLSRADKNLIAQETQQAAKHEIMTLLAKRKEVMGRINTLELEQNNAWTKVLPEIMRRLSDPQRKSSGTPHLDIKDADAHEKSYQERSLTIESLRSQVVMLDANLTATLTESAYLLGLEDLLREYKKQILSADVVQAVVNELVHSDKRQTIEKLTAGYQGIHIPERSLLDRFQSRISAIKLKA